MNEASLGIDGEAAHRLLLDQPLVPLLQPLHRRRRGQVAGGEVDLRIVGVREKQWQVGAHHAAQGYVVAYEHRSSMFAGIDDVNLISELDAHWERHYAGCPPEADLLKSHHTERWVRFHSLPGSKRYAGTEAEYATILHRYNTVLDEMFAGRTVYVVTCSYHGPGELTAHHNPHALNPTARLWRRIPSEEDDAYYAELHAARRSWRSGMIDALLRAVADGNASGVMIFDTEAAKLHHPYDGGADCILCTTAERDNLRAAHPGWLSDHPQGL